MLLIRLILLTVVFAACPMFCHAQGQASTSSNQPIYPSGWETLISAWRQNEEAEYNETGSYVATMKKKIKKLGRGETKPEIIVFTIHTKSGYKHMTATTGTGEESVYARSPDYAFALKRRQQEQEWKLVHFMKASTSIYAHRFEESLPGGFGLSVLYPLGTLLENNRGSKYFYDDRLKARIKDLKLIEEERPRLEWTRDAGEYHASLVMDPAPNYIMRKFESRSSNPKSPRRTTFIRELLADGKRPASPLPLCKSIAYKLLVDKEGGEIMNDVQVAFSDYTFDPPSDDIFRLSHYGLPESPAGTRVARKKPWLWLLAVSAGCIGLAFLFRRLARRKIEPPSSGENP